MNSTRQQIYLLWHGEYLHNRHTDLLMPLANPNLTPTQVA